MKITRRQLRRIIQEAIAGDFTSNALAAIEADDVRAFATLMVDKYGQEAYLDLEDMKFDIPAFASVRDWLQDPEIEQAVHSEMNRREDQAIALSSNPEELAALADAFHTTVSDANLEYIRYQPRRKGGKIVSLSLEDIDNRLGGMSASLDAKRAESFDTTVQAVVDVLEKGGAELRKRRKHPKHVPPMYD